MLNFPARRRGLGGLGGVQSPRPDKISDFFPQSSLVSEFEGLNRFNSHFICGTKSCFFFVNVRITQSGRRTSLIIKIINNDC